MNDLRIYQKAISILEAGDPVALATVIATDGSTPGKVGYTMIVGGRKGQTEGTIGGGATEGEIICIAQKGLSKTRRQIIRYDLSGTENAERGICGGAIDYLVETFDRSYLPLFYALSKTEAEGRSAVLVSMLSPNKPPEKFILDSVEAGPSETGLKFTAETVKTIHDLIAREQSSRIILAGGAEAFVEIIAERPMVYIFGAGHLAQAISHYAKRLNFRISICDERTEFANSDRFPEADQIITEKFEGLFQKVGIRDNSYLVIVTRGHQCDQIVLEQAIKTSMKYIGMIGSRRKTSMILKHLYEKGIPAERLRSVFSPIGLDIGAVTPEEIAISIVSEMVKIRRRGPSGGASHLKMDVVQNPGKTHD